MTVPDAQRMDSWLGAGFPSVGRLPLGRAVMLRTDSSYRPCGFPSLTRADQAELSTLHRVARHTGRPFARGRQPSYLPPLTLNPYCPHCWVAVVGGVALLKTAICLSGPEVNPAIGAGLQTAM